MINGNHSIIFLCDIPKHFTTLRYSGLSSLINGTSENTIQNLQTKQQNKFFKQNMFSHTHHPQSDNMYIFDVK